MILSHRVISSASQLVALQSSNLNVDVPQHPQVPLLAAPMAGITAAPLRLMYTQVGPQPTDKGWGEDG